MRRRWLAAPFAIINGSAFARIVKPADKEEALAQNRRGLPKSKSISTSSALYGTGVRNIYLPPVLRGKEEEKKKRKKKWPQI